MGKNQSSYHLSDYMPLLKQGLRAIFDAAPIKQNIPPEIPEQFRAQQKQSNVINFLERYADVNENRSLTDLVTVQLVDLRKYDNLSIGKEVKLDEHAY